MTSVILRILFVLFIAVPLAVVPFKCSFEYLFGPEEEELVVGMAVVGKNGVEIKSLDDYPLELVDPKEKVEILDYNYMSYSNLSDTSETINEDFLYVKYSNPKHPPTIGWVEKSRLAPSSYKFYPDSERVLRNRAYVKGFIDNTSNWWSIVLFWLYPVLLWAVWYLFSKIHNWLAGIFFYLSFLINVILFYGAVCCIHLLANYHIGFDAISTFSTFNKLYLVSILTAPAIIVFTTFRIHIMGRRVPFYLSIIMDPIYGAYVLMMLSWLLSCLPLEWLSASVQKLYDYWSYIGIVLFILLIIVKFIVSIIVALLVSLSRIPSNNLLVCFVICYVFGITRYELTFFEGHTFLYYGLCVVAILHAIALVEGLLSSRCPKCHCADGVRYKGKEVDVIYGSHKTTDYLGSRMESQNKYIEDHEIDYEVATKSTYRKEHYGCLCGYDWSLDDSSREEISKQQTAERYTEYTSH